jgi:glutathione peroxidase
VETHGAKGFTVLAFPCNQFGRQESGTNQEIKEFVKQYNVSFPMFDKINVNGPEAHPLYKWLKDVLPGSLGIKGIKWNFTKFLINKQGKPIQRYGPPTEPKAIEQNILKLLEQDTL